MMNNKPLSGTKIAILLANGFCQQDVVETQRLLMEAGATPTIVSPDQGLVNGWDGQSWGHNFMVDAALDTALGADYDMLILPGGERSMDKLKMTAHTKRFITSFMMAEKPVAVMGDALHLLMITDNMSGRTVSGPAEMKDVVMQAGGQWSDDMMCFDSHMMSGDVMAEGARPAFVAKMVVFFTAMAHQMDEAA